MKKYNKRHFLAKYSLVDFSDPDTYTIKAVGNTKFGTPIQKYRADKGFIKCMEAWEVWNGYKRIK